MATSRSIALLAALAAPLALAQPAAPLAFAQAAAPARPASSVTTASGLVYTELKAGNGPRPLATDVVRVHYRGSFPDGKEFDSSFKRGQPAEFPLDRVIKCWTEGVQLMKVGTRAKLVCPAVIVAYGERGTPGGPIPPNATLHFEIDLLAVVKR